MRWKRNSIKYSFIVIAFISSLSLFSGISGEQDFSMLETVPQNIISADTTPRYPVKKTQITNYKDLEVSPPADLQTPSNVKTTVEYDPSTGYYIYRTKVGDTEIATPFSLSSEEYKDYSLKKSMADYFKTKNIESYTKKDEKEEFSLKDIKLNLGAAERLFGPGGVKVKTQGYVEASLGMRHQNNENPTLSEKNRKRTSFEFKEDIQMNVTASVGDRINFGMNYDTKAMFDFDSKKLNLAYDPKLAGDEDGILRRLEAGNVSMHTTNSLINGGTALFGINAELQFGKLKINTVVSQQESESQTINSKGGIQTTSFEFKADQYDENRHFFLAHYFRNNYDVAMSKLPYIQSPINISRIEVWITNKRSDFNQSRNIVAFADLAEYTAIKNTSKWHQQGTDSLPYNKANNLYESVTTNPAYSGSRDRNQTNNILETNGLNNGLDYEKVESARLLNPSEYTFNPQLGYISLISALQADEVLAVAYEFKVKGVTYQVGEFSTDIVDKYDSNNNKSGALFVKMLKPVSLSPRAYTWDLMMKNVYNLGANSIQKDRFRLNISYQSDTLGTYINYIPEGKIKNQLLLKAMNLDRLNSQNQPVHSKDDPSITGDGIFDFVEGFTVVSQSGRIYFPVVEPFGSHLKRKINDDFIAKKYIYQELYDSTLTVAQQIAEKNKFKISGSYRGASSSNAEINLNATNIPKGSVRVTASGATLIEGTHYIVDYISGILTIIDQNLIDTNANIQVSLEGRTMSMQRKTLLGLNLSYDISKKFNIGGTIMHLYEKPLTTKTEFGHESVKNTLWGLNTSYKTESMWLTNLIDKLPFINATQPSQISFNGEFAHMIPGHYQSKQNGGYSYLDDFETAESRIDLKSPYAWTLASTPSAILNKTTDTIQYGIDRAMLAWFMVDPIFTREKSSLKPEHIIDEDLSSHYVREVRMEEIYPKKDVAYNETATIPVLNLSYYPTQRGPYNLDNKNIDADGKLLNPKQRWGGITRKMDVRDFETSNIEYIEFWLMDPFVYNSDPTKYKSGGDLYFNLGEISEDVLKDGKKFYENGLPVNGEPDAVDYTIWGKVPKRQSTVYAFDNNLSAADRKKQDVGLNGLSTEEEFSYKTYVDYLNGYKSKLSTDAFNRLSNDAFSPLNDPAGDKYQFYRGAQLDTQKASILDRYKYYNNTEGNSPATKDSGESFSTAARTTPDVEDIDQDNTLNETESYFEYKVSLDPKKMNVGENYIVDSRKVSVALRNGKSEDVTWYQFKIPIRQYKKVGRIQDFKSIRFMRMYMTNFQEETFLRFGTLQLVRGDWRLYQQTLNKDNNPSGTGSLDLSTVNIEENSDREPVNYILPPGVSRVLDPDQSQLTQENEQSLSLKVLDLEAGDARAIYKNTIYDMRRYKRLQLFTHAEELINGPKLTLGDLSVFIRLGSDYKNNYYEYEIPLSITPAGVYSANSDRYTVWPKDNMFDFPLELLKNVKLNRNREKRKAGSTISYTTLYHEYDPEKPTNKVSVVGNPSLSDVSVIMIGVRNNSRLNKSGEVWVNELRLTDFDEEGGWAAQGNLNIAFSDVGTLNVSGRRETSGFGALDQSLQERRQDDYYDYNIAASVELGRFLPEKAKVSLPLYYSYTNQTITPKYDPFDQDVTLKESLSLMDTKAEKDSINNLARERSTTKSISLSNVKVNIQSKTPMPYDPANFNFGYTYNQTEIKNPTTVYDITKNYRAVLNYSYSPLMKTWEPFKKKKGKSGATKFAKSLAFNYLPNNIAFNSNINRFYTETLIRDIDSYSLGGENNSQFLSWSQNFTWERDLNLNWDFTKNLKFTFQSGTKAEIEEPYLQVNKKLNRDDYEIWKDSVMRSIRNLGDPLAYKQTTKVTYQLPTKSISALDWLTSNVSYNSNYQWDRGAKIKGIEIGNTINNNITLDFTNRLNLINLYNKSKFLKRVNERFDSRKRTPSAAQRRRAENEEQEKSKRFKQDIMLTLDSATTIKHGLNSKNLRVTARKDGKTYRIKFKKISENEIRIQNKDSVQLQLSIESRVKDTESNKLLREIADYSVRGLMSVRSIEFNYSKRNETNIAGFRPGIGDAFGQKGSDYGLSPGLGFAFGFEGGEDFIQKSLERDWLVINETNITPAVYNNMEKFDLRAQLEPIKDLKINLNAKYENNKRTEIQYMYQGSPKMLGGNFSMTTIALATSLRGSNAKNNYQSKAFDKFLENRNIIKDRFDSQYQGLNVPAMDGVNINSADVLVPAFIAAYTGKDVNKIKLSAFPSLLSALPNWTISYDGLSKVPFIKDKFKSLRLNHSYICSYQIGSYNSYSDWMSTDGDLGYIHDILSGNPIASSPYNIGSVTISEAFNPLFGVDGTLNNNMTMKARYNNSRMLTLNMSSYQIIETLYNELVIGFAYRINEFNRVMGMTSKNSKNFNNDLDIKADLSYKINESLLRKIEENFTQATNGTTIVTLKISADYTVSRSLTIRAFFDRIMNKPLISSASYPTTNSNYGISFRFTLMQ